jgi:hypothetical protein
MLLQVCVFNMGKEMLFVCACEGACEGVLLAVHSPASPLLSLHRYVFPDFNYQWLVDEIKLNLPKELDFTHEAANAERCRRLLASRRSAVGDR